MPALRKTVNRVDHWPHVVPGYAPVKREVFNLVTTDNKPEWPAKTPHSPMHMLRIVANSDMDWRYNESAWDPRIDIASLTRYSIITAPQPRLYAKVQSLIANDLRDGAEWGMNVIQYKKAWQTFLQLVVTASVIVTAFAKANKAGITYLSKRPRVTPKKLEREIRTKQQALASLRRKELAKRIKLSDERRRINNELYILRTMAATLLAYRYGVAPIMSDIFKTHALMTQPSQDDFNIRLTRAVGVRALPLDGWFTERWDGSHRYTVRYTAKVDNPNVWLANRLGLLNPLYWAWDATPWSFVVDWWLPVGDVLQSYTAYLGLSWIDGSDTVSYKGKCKLEINYWGLKYHGSAWFKGKDRTRLVAFPNVTSLYFGKGLNVQRSQNALALIVQKLSPKRL